MGEMPEFKTPQGQQKNLFPVLMFPSPFLRFVFRREGLKVDFVWKPLTSHSLIFRSSSYS